jgi:ketosteroid isomerase-like protein
MSQENVEVVRGHNEPYDGQELVAVIKAALDRLGPQPTRDEVLSLWAQDPGWRHVHPDIEWDVTGVGAVGSTTKGPLQVAAWWKDWIETWDSYVYRIAEYRDLGDWVLTPVDVEARGSGGLPVSMRLFQIWKLRDGKIAVFRAFLSEQEALEPARLRE